MYAIKTMSTVPRHFVLSGISWLTFHVLKAKEFLFKTYALSNQSIQFITRHILTAIYNIHNQTHI